MTTVANPEIRAAQAYIKAHNANAVFDGDAGDWDHEHIKANQGYHDSRADLLILGPDNYSIQYPVDHGGPQDYPSAWDLGLPAADAVLYSGRLEAALRRGLLPRCRGFNAWDGTRERRYDRNDPTRTDDDRETSSSDSPGHIHIEVYRTWSDNADVWMGIAKIMLGQSLGPVLHYPFTLPKGNYYSQPGGPLAHSIGPNVVLIQKRLITLGIYHGTASGTFGPVTAKAVVAYKGKHMPGALLNDDVGVETWDHLFTY